jgi:hypothetical protein
VDERQCRVTVRPSPRRYPFFRTTGVTIVVDVEYTNVKKGEKEPGGDSANHVPITVMICQSLG